MQFIKSLNQIIYFLLELCMLGSLGYAGFHSSQQSIGNYSLGIGLPLVAAILWGFFAAPRSTYRLEFPYRSLFALTLFSISFFMLYKTGQTRLATTLGITALISELVAVFLK